MRRVLTLILAACLCLFISLPTSEATQKDSLRSVSSSLSHLKLKGTLFTDSLNPVAIIEDTRSNQVAVYELGDRLEGAEIVSIVRGEAVLKSKDAEIRLAFPEGAVAYPSKAVTEDGLWYKIRREGDVFILDEATIANATRRVVDIMKDVSIKPSFRDGKPTGVMVTKLTPVGILKEAGVREGDIIKTINGLTLNSPYQIFSAYKRLKDEKEIRVEIIRNNNPLVLTYKITK